MPRRRRRTRPLPIELRAGDLRATFVDGDLRDVRWRDSPVAQRIYMAVRDRTWNTIPGQP